jgi:hypothetical protein
MANRYAPVPPEAANVELYATPNWMVVPEAHSTDSGCSGGFCWLGSAAEMGFAGSCGEAVEMTAKNTDRIAVLINAPLRHPRPANAVSISGQQRQKLLTHLIVYSIQGQTMLVLGLPLV